MFEGMSACEITLNNVKKLSTILTQIMSKIKALNYKIKFSNNQEFLSKSKK